MTDEQPPKFMQSVKEWLGLKNGNGSARDVLEELIEEREEAEVPIDDDERALS